jgi:hypothetical protein
MSDFGQAMLSRCCIEENGNFGRDGFRSVPNIFPSIASRQGWGEIQMQAGALFAVPPLENSRRDLPDGLAVKRRRANTPAN